MSKTKATRGLLGTANGFEYFQFSKGGDVYRADSANPLDVDGYRMGARFESTVAGWPLGLRVLGDAFKAK